jgi:hypothetical protein
MKNKTLIAAMLIMAACFMATNTFAQGKTDTTAGMQCCNNKMKDCCMMKDGKMVQMKGGKMMPMDKDMTMKNGAKCTTTGDCIMKDGKKMKMKNGDCMDMDGNVGTCPMNCDGKKHHHKKK